MTYSSPDDPSHLYFITATIVAWKPLFRNPDYADIPLNCLDWLQKRERIRLFAFVVMPSHLHAILKPEAISIGEVLQQFGSFTAHRILQELRKDRQEDLLILFHARRRDSRHEHSIWQDIQAKNVFSAEFLWQKMEYIHQNPVAKDWHLASDRADYLYSSAAYYDRGRTPLIELTDIHEWLASNPFAEDGEGSIAL
jgi:putative transposase